MSMFKSPILLNEVMRYSFVISVNKERLSLCYEIFDKTIGLRPRHMNGHTENKNNIKNCQLSHYECILTAKKHNFPFVLIFEDDVFPCRNVGEKFQWYLDCIPLDAKLVLFGWLRDYKRMQNFSNTYNKISSLISGAHAYMIFASGYDFYLKFFKDNPNLPADDNIFKNFPNGYILNEPLFIQHNFNKSMHGHRGYVGVVDSKTPPDGFDSIEAILSL